MCKKLMGQMPSRLAYGANVVMSMEYIMPSPHIAVPMDMTNHGALEDGVTQLEELKEECLGPDEEIQQGNIRLQELMNERVRLREKTPIWKKKSRSLRKE